MDSVAGGPTRGRVGRATIGVDHHLFLVAFAVGATILLVLMSAMSKAADGAAATERVSVDSAGGQANNDSDLPDLSADGRYVAFQSAAANLVAGDTNSTFDVFVHDRATSSTERVSVASSGAQ